MKTTTHLLTKNNSDTIEKALKSLLPIDGDIIVGDLGSNDDTIAICLNYGAKVVEIRFEDNYSKARNTLIDMSGSPKQFYLEPWEVLVAGHKTISEVQNGTYSVQVWRGDLITKEIRLWSKSSNFVNPVYEIINSDHSEELDVVIYSTKTQGDYNKKISIVNKWVSSHPFDKEPYYYKAFALLEAGRHKEFVEAAKDYLFRDNAGIAAITMQYYLALIQLYIGDIKSSVRGAVGCIAAKPLMAEFWCLLGDIHYKTHQYKKATLYYENAMILGGKRLKSDAWPIEISKYKKYPTKMIDSCNDILKNTKVLKKS